MATSIGTVEGLPGSGEFLLSLSILLKFGFIGSYFALCFEFFGESWRIFHVGLN